MIFLYKFQSCLKIRSDFTLFLTVEKFWALEERIRNDKKDTGVQLRMSRSNCIYNIASLLNEGAITMDDLEEFSDELKERVRFIAK